MPTERVTFRSADGQSLAARLELPAGRRPRTYALFAHCFTCSMNVKAAVRVSRTLAQQGIGVLRFDFAGLGESEGDFADTNFSSNVEDLLAAGEYLATHHQAPAILIGHSLGGAAVLQAAQYMPTVLAVATIGAPSDPAHIVDLLSESLDEIRSRGEAVVQLAGRSIQLKHQFVDDLYAAKVDEAVRTLDRALLIFHSPVDTTVSVDHAARIFELARHPKSYVSLDDADHFLSRPEDSAYVGAVLATWARKYVDLAPVHPHQGHSHARNEVAIEVGTSYTAEIWAQGHSLVADEPKSIGGNDLGPSPYGLLMSSLGACTTITVRMYANRKNWPLEGIDVAIRHRRVHSTDEDEVADTRIDEMVQTVTLKGPLDKSQRKRLMQIAGRCPVHRTLDAGVRIITKNGGRD